MKTISFTVSETDPNTNKTTVKQEGKISLLTCDELLYDLLISYDPWTDHEYDLTYGS